MRSMALGDTFLIVPESVDDIALRVGVSRATLYHHLNTSCPQDQTVSDQE
jgi:hypothetical protein